MDRPLNVFNIKLFCFSIEFNETWSSCKTRGVLQNHQVLSNFEEKQKFFMYDTFNGQSSV